MSKYMVIGGTGFLGSYICKNLLDGGHSVVCYDYTLDANSIQQVLSLEELERVELIRGDITDYIHLAYTCKEQQIERIILTAATLLTACEQNVPAAIKTNILGPVHVFEAARLCGIKRVVYASSDSSLGSRYFFGDTPVANDAIHNPNCLYGMTKYMDEFIGKFYNERYGMETVGLRYSTIYGMARMRGGANWIKALINDPTLGIPSEVPHGDSPAFNVIYVKDAARIAVLASQVPAEQLTRHAYAATGDVSSISEIKEYVMSLLPDAQIKVLPGDFDVAPVRYDTSVEERDLGYTPEYTYKMGVLETMNNIRAQRGLPPV